MKLAADNVFGSENGPLPLVYPQVIAKSFHQSGRNTGIGTIFAVPITRNIFFSFLKVFWINRG
jgi:hypothetical protein